MTTGSTGTKRRTLLQRGFALLAGGAALAGGTRWAAAASTSAEATVDKSPPTAKTLTVYARKRPIAGTPSIVGPNQAVDGRIVSSGDLLDGPDGNYIGTFYTNCFCVLSPFGGHTASASSLEFHVLQLQDGTLFSMGSGIDDTSAPRPLAILGGTGRFAARQGTVIERAVAGADAADDVRQLTVTFAA
jgi:hypothetical protein